MHFIDFRYRESYLLVLCIRQVKPRPIAEVAAAAGFAPDEIWAYGPVKAKVLIAARARMAEQPNGNYVVVTGINPTPLGEGKSTTTIGLRYRCRMRQLLLKHKLCT